MPKQLLELGGRSLLAAIGRRLPVASRRQRRHRRGAGGRAGGAASLARRRAGVRLVAGGERRQDSVATRSPPSAAECDIVLVHDAARPFVTADVIARAIDGGVRARRRDRRRAGERHGEARGAAGVIVETLPREEIFLAQTPQAFRREVLGAAIELGRTAVAATDEAMLAERAGHRVHVVSGDAANVKITTAADLDRARARMRPSATRGASRRRLRPAPAGRRPAARARRRDRAGRARRARALRCRRHLPCRDRRDPRRRPGRRHRAALSRHRPALEGRVEHCAADATWSPWSVPVASRSRTSTSSSSSSARRSDRTATRYEASVAAALGIDASRVSVKAKTNEGVDAVGRGEAIAAQAVALLRRD